MPCIPAAVLIGNATLYCGDCRDILPNVARVGVGKTVLDPYMGSGSTGVACQRIEVAQQFQSAPANYGGRITPAPGTAITQN